MQHTALAGGPKAMEVDHFDPTLEGEERNAYSNLLLATRHCNLAKGDRWPNEEDRAAGIRFLNPCEEQDYGVHLFEDPVTNELSARHPPAGGISTSCYSMLLILWTSADEELK